MLKLLNKYRTGSCFAVVVRETDLTSFTDKHTICRWKHNSPPLYNTGPNRYMIYMVHVYMYNLKIKSTHGSTGKDL